VEAVKHIRLSGTVGPDALNKVGGACLQFTGNLTQRVLERDRAGEKHDVTFRQISLAQ